MVQEISNKKFFTEIYFKTTNIIFYQRYGIRNLEEIFVEIFWNY